MLAASAGLVALFLFTGVLDLWQSLVTLVVIALAALIGDARSGPVKLPQVDAAEQHREVDRAIGAVVGAFPDAVILLDAADRVLASNPAAREIAPALAVDQPVTLALRIPEVHQAVRQARAAGARQRAEFVTRVPIERWFELIVAPLPPSDVEPASHRGRLILVFHDMTPMRRVEEMRVDFVANASHELRTPLASLSGFIETLQGSARDDPAANARFLQIMKTQADRMARLIDDLLSLSRVELVEHVAPTEPLDLVSAVRQVVDGLQMLARDREVSVSFNLPAAPLTVLGDRDELIRVFENLIENAMKYGGSGKRLIISMSQDMTADGSPEAVASVRDFGPGIAPEHLPRLTERFYRVDMASSRAEGGTGLGLSLVKHIVNRHRGRLQIESELGKGATFTVRLPLVGAPAGAAKSPSG